MIFKGAKLVRDGQKTSIGLNSLNHTTIVEEWCPQLKVNKGRSNGTLILSQ